MDIHLGYRPGCIGRVAQLPAAFYAEATGFGVDFEAKVAKELSDFCLSFAEGRGGLWLVTDGACNEGAIAIDGTHAAEQGAHLRWFITSDQTRGTGMGHQLLVAALAFATTRDTARCSCGLLTNWLPHATCTKKCGSRLSLARPGSQWGREATMLPQHQDTVQP